MTSARTKVRRPAMRSQCIYVRGSCVRAHATERGLTRQRVTFNHRFVLNRLHFSVTRVAGDRVVSDYSVVVLPTARGGGAGASMNLGTPWEQ